MEKKSKGPAAQWSKEEIAVEARDLARRGVEERSLKKLLAAFDLNPATFEKGWRQRQPMGGMEMDTMALPEAARAGWARGVELLASLGVDTNCADADRQGFGLGKAPIVEALSGGHFEAAQALFDAGASVDHLANLVWAAGFQAQRKGVKAGIAVLDWIEARGVFRWIDDGKSKSVQSAYLFTGSLRRLDRAETQAWEERLFKGMGDGQGAAACLWNHMFCLSSGVDKSRGLCERYVKLADVGEARGKRAREMLESALLGGCPVAAQVAAERLAPSVSDWESLGGAALQAACEARNPGQDTDPVQQNEAVRALWRVVGGRLAAHRPALERACFQAMLNGHVGLFEGLMDVSDLSPRAVVEHWRAGMPGPGDREHAPKRAQWERCAVAAMSKQLRESGSEPGMRALRLFEAFDPPSYKGVDRTRFDRMFAQAERIALEAQATPRPVAGATGRMRL